MATWSGIEYYEDAKGSPHESWATDASKATRTLLFFGADRTTGPDVADREIIAQTWLGYAYVATGTGGRKAVKRFTPHYLPAVSGTPYLYCTALVSGELVGRPLRPTTHRTSAPGDRLAKSLCWRATFQYSVLPYDIREDDAILANGGPLYVGVGDAYPDEGRKLAVAWSGTRYITKQVEHGGRVIPLRAGLFFYQETGTLGSADPPTAVGTSEPIPFNEAISYITYTWHGVPADAVPFIAIGGQLNTVNDAKFDGFNKGTLLLVGHKLLPRRDSFGTRTFDVQYRMMYCARANSAGVGPLGHNAILRVRNDAAPAWWLVTANGDGAADDTKRIYRYTDFERLFRPDQPGGI